MNGRVIPRERGSMFNPTFPADKREIRRMICCRLRQTALPGTLVAGSLLTPSLVGDVIQLQFGG